MSDQLAPSRGIINGIPVSIVLWAAILFMLSGCASVADALPPPPCDYTPTKLHSVVELPAHLAAKVCKGPAACTISGSMIVIPKDGFTPLVRGIMLRHEYGHVNCPNWNHNG